LCTPLCVTPTAVNGSDTSVAVTATVTGDNLPVGLQADFASAYSGSLATLRISTTERPTIISQEMIRALIYGLAIEGGASNVSVALTLPAADVTLAAGHVATAGAVSVT
jgi:hypothetical protein